MAVLRDSRPVNPVSQAMAPDVAQSSGGATKTPNVRKFAKGPSTADLLIDAVVPVLHNFGKQAWEVQKEEAYLSGVRQASEVESEEDLQQSTFTKDWSTAGFRDTKGRTAQAEFVAGVPQAIAASMSKENPQEYFSGWMQQQQDKLVGTYEGMSRKARAASFAQNATDIQTAQRSFTKEYAKHIISTEEKSLQSSFTAMRQQLDANKDDDKAYRSASTSFATNVYKNVWLNDKLPEANKIELTKQAVEYAASSDNVMVYDLLKQMQFDFPDGSKGTIMQKMPFEDQVALDKSQRQSMERTKVIRAASFEETMARQQSQWADPNGPGPSIGWPELQGQLDLAVEHGILSQARYGSITKDYFTALSRNGSDDALAQMYAAGDFPGIVQSGKTEAQALGAFMKANAGQPYQAQVQSLMSIGKNSGLNSAYTKAGELMAPAIAQLGYSEDIDPESANMVNSFVMMLDDAQQTNPGAYSRMLEGIPQGSQDMILMMRTAQRSYGIADPATAVQWARTRIKDAQGPAATAARTTNARVDAKAVQELEATSWFEQIDRNFGNAAAVRPARGFWFENDDVVANVTGQSKIVMAQELDRINRESPFLSDDSRLDKAMAAAATRAVPTGSGPLFMPEGQNVSRYFGVPQYADKEYVGQAIDEMIPLESGQRIEWSLSQVQGAPMMYRITNEDGVTVSAGQLDPKSVGVKVQENLDRDASIQSNQTGPGKLVSKGGASVQYNGENTAGFDPRSMLLLRDDIVNSEGISNTSYDDGKVVKGNRSFGVGISQTGKRFQEPLGRDGLYTQKQINTSFMEASNDAAETASRVMRGTNLLGDDWLRFFGELAYQSPASARDKDMLAYISLGNEDGAITALKATNAYKNSPPERQDGYVRKLKKAMK